MGTSIDYSAVSHETIYQRITGGAGGTGLVDTSAGWQSIVAKLEKLHGSLEQAIRGIGAAQQGAAADAATRATMALLPWLAHNASVASDIAARTSRQANSFEYTQRNMPTPVKIPEVSFSQDPLTYIGQHAVEWMGGIQTEHERAKVAAQQAEQRARELMTSYQSASNDNLAISQSFTLAPRVVADVSDPSLDGAGVGGASVGGSAAHGTPYSGVAPAAAGHSTPAVAGHAANVAPTGTAPQVASGTHQTPAAATSPQLDGGYTGPVGQPMTEAGRVRPPAATDFGPSPVFAGSGAAGGHRVSGGSRGVGGGVPMSRGSGFGPRPSAVLGEAYSPTASAGQASTEQASVGRAVRGSGGWAGLPFGATGSTGRDGDAEHRRPSYLIEQDTNSIVGDLPPVAPPVIGED